MEYKRIRVAGNDAVSFLQGLITSDVTHLEMGPKYAALLTPQGKYISDFFALENGVDVLLEVPEPLVQTTFQRLSMYKLRADVTLSKAPGFLHRGVGDAPEDAWFDPRNEALGWRAWREAPQEGDSIDWDALRVAHCIPNYGTELGSDSFILEMNFETLGGVDFKKGCYVGQEVTARMKHKTTLRKGLTTVQVQGSANCGDEIMNSEGKSVGTLMTRAGPQALAYLRFDRAGGSLHSGEATITWVPPE